MTRAKEEEKAKAQIQEHGQKTPYHVQVVDGVNLIVNCMCRTHGMLSHE